MGEARVLQGLMVLVCASCKLQNQWVFAWLAYSLDSLACDLERVEDKQSIP